jgi:hypothetical protein
MPNTAPSVGVCGSIPCVSILPNTGERCGTYGIAPAYHLVNHAANAATVSVLVTAYQNGQRWTRLDSDPIAANGNIFIGCASDTESGQRVTYTIQAVAWHP